MKTRRRKIWKELDAKLREKLGLAEDADIVKAVEDIKIERKSLLRKLDRFVRSHVTSQRQRKFAEQFPEQARELEEARKERVENRAIKFSESIAELRFGNDGKQQLSQLVLEKVANVHKKFSEKAATVDDLEDLLKSMGNDKALVPVGEEGSERGKRIKFSESDNPRLHSRKWSRKLWRVTNCPMVRHLSLQQSRIPNLQKRISEQSLKHRRRVVNAY
jgi:hypothetical protein